MKEECLSKHDRETTNELHLKVLFETLPFETVYNSPVHSHPATYNGNALRLNLNTKENGAGWIGLSFKSNTSCSSFHWVAVCRKCISGESQMKSWCDCRWCWLHESSCRFNCVMCNYSGLQNESRVLQLNSLIQNLFKSGCVKATMTTLKAFPLTEGHRWAWQHLTAASVCSASAAEHSDSCTKGLWHVQHDSPAQQRLWPQ